MDNSKTITSWRDVREGTVLWRLPMCVHLAASYNNPLDRDVYHKIFMLSLSISPDDVQWRVVSNDIGATLPDSCCGYNTEIRKIARDMLTEQRFVYMNKMTMGSSVYAFVRNSSSCSGNIKYFKRTYCWGSDDDPWAFDENGFLYTFDYDEFCDMSSDLMRLWKTFIQDELKILRKYIQINTKRYGHKKTKKQVIG